MSDHTPTDAEVRHEYVMSFLVEYQQDASDEFDRWIAAHDAKVRAETLREFAHSIPGDIHDPRQVADLARGVADHIEREAGL